MLKKTLLASSVCVALTFASQGVQANPVTNLLDGFVNGFTSQQLDARRGGGARRTSSVRRSTTTSSSRTTSSSTANKSSLTDTKTTSTTSSTQNKTTSQNTNTQQANANTQQTNANQQDATFNRNNANYNQGYNQPAQASGGLGMGSTFISSLAGAGAGVLLANMLLSPAAAAEQGTEVATPDMLSDDQIKECLSQLEKDVADAETRLAEAAEDQKAAISEEISQMHSLQTVLLKEQLNRLQNQ